MDPYIHKDKTNTGRGITRISLAPKDELNIDIRIALTIKRSNLEKVLSGIDKIVETNSVTIGEDLIKE